MFIEKIRGPKTYIVPMSQTLTLLNNLLISDFLGSSLRRCERVIFHKLSVEFVGNFFWIWNRNQFVLIQVDAVNIVGFSLVPWKLSSHLMKSVLGWILFAAAGADRICWSHRAVNTAYFKRLNALVVFSFLFIIYIVFAFSK